MSQIESIARRNPREDERPTGAQLRAGRAVLNMSVRELSERTGLALNTIRAAEKSNGPAACHPANAALLVRTLEELGVTFVQASDGLGSGARLTDPNQTPLARWRPQPKAKKVTGVTKDRKRRKSPL